MPNVTVVLDISADELLLWYRGQAHSVRARASDGRWVRFPASVLRPHVTMDGVRGLFLIEFDADNRFKGIRRVERSR